MADRSTPEASFADRRIGYAIGDIHGCAALLDTLLAEIARDLESVPRNHEPPILIFLGDYIDRGVDSRGVIDRLIAETAREGVETRCLLGNHEQAMLFFLEQPVRGAAWLVHGGMETLQSYGVATPSLKAKSDELTAARDALAAALPAEHLAFLRKLERFALYGDYVFAHAGVNPSKTIWKQTDADLFWIRERFLKSKRAFPYVVVHGHTPAPEFYRDARRIGVDTGAYMSGRLTAVRLQGCVAHPITVTAPKSTAPTPASAPINS